MESTKTDTEPHSLYKWEVFSEIVQMVSSARLNETYSYSDLGIEVASYLEKLIDNKKYRTNFVNTKTKTTRNGKQNYLGPDF